MNFERTFAGSATLRSRALAASAIAIAAFSALMASAPTSPARAAEEIKVTVVSGHAPVLLWVKELHDSFIPAVDAELAKTGKYKIVWNEAYGGTLAKVGEELEAIQNGLADTGVAWSVFDAAKLPLQNVTLFTPFLNADIVSPVEIIEELQREIPEFGQQWEKYNQVYLGGRLLADPFQLWTRTPVQKTADLKGLKIAGPGPAINWVKDTGAVGVAGNLASYYNDLKTGVYDGVIVFYTGGAPAKLYEVAPHVAKVDFATTYGGGITFNRDRWQKLPDEVKTAFHAGAAAFSANFLKGMNARLAAAEAQMKQGGAKITELSPEDRKAWAMQIPNVAKGWAEGLDKRGLPGTKVLKAFMEKVRARGFKPLRDWDRE